MAWQISIPIKVMILLMGIKLHSVNGITNRYIEYFELLSVIFQPIRIFLCFRGCAEQSTGFASAHIASSSP